MNIEERIVDAQGNVIQEGTPITAEMLNSIIKKALSAVSIHDMGTATLTTPAGAVCHYVRYSNGWQKIIFNSINIAANQQRVDLPESLAFLSASSYAAIANRLQDTNPSDSNADIGIRRYINNRSFVVRASSSSSRTVSMIVEGRWA